MVHRPCPAHSGKLCAMGFLRLILALSVVAGHGEFFRPFFFINASAAVVCFFVISGFYMALVLNEKYTRWQDFARARVLRLYPTYYFFLLIALLLWAHDGREGDPLALLIAVSLVGQDYYMIATLPGDDALRQVPIAQAWSISVELQFYALAAFAFKSRRGIVSVFVGGALLRAAMYFAGYLYSPLGTWLSLNSLVFFGAGGVAYLLYKRVEARPKAERAAFAAFAIACLVVYAHHFDGLRWMDGSATEIRFYPIYVGIAFLTPFLFSLTKNSAIDRAIGEFSYPVYLSHLLAFDIANRFEQGRIFVLMLTALMSALAYFLVVKLIDNNQPRRASPAGRTSASNPSRPCRANGVGVGRSGRGYN